MSGFHVWVPALMAMSMRVSVCVYRHKWCLCLYVSLHVHIYVYVYVRVFTAVSKSAPAFRFMFTFVCHHPLNCQLMTSLSVASMHVFKATTLLVGDSTLCWVAQVTAKYAVVPCQSFFCSSSWCQKPLRLKNFLASFLLVVHLLKKKEAFWCRASLLPSQSKLPYISVDMPLMFLMLLIVSIKSESLYTH